MDEVLSLMASGFLKGGIGFLKTGAGEMIKGGAMQSRDIRVGVTHVNELILIFGSITYLFQNNNIFCRHM